MRVGGAGRALGLAGALAAGALAGCGATAAPGATLPPVPLAAATDLGATAHATLPMGDLASAASTFWELLVRADGRWRLATPPDVETSGGLVASASAALTVVGVLATDRLTFSPLARSVDGSATWATGVAPGALAPTPSALAGADDATLAVLRSDGGSVVSSDPGLAAWTTVGTTREIAAESASGGCRLRALTSAAIVNSTDVVGGTCAAHGRGPIAARRGGRWRLVGPRLTATAAQVLRVGATTDGVVAVLETASATTRALVVTASGRDLRSWPASPALALQPGTRVRATTLEPGRALVVLRLRDGRLVVRTGAAGARWTAAVALPPGTVDVVGGGTAPLEALSSHRVVVTVWARSRGAWRAVQRLIAPIAVGPSH